MRAVALIVGLGHRRLRTGAGFPSGAVRIRTAGRLGAVSFGGAGRARMEDRHCLVRIPEITFWEAAAKADALGLAIIAGDSAQKFSVEIPKKLDCKLAPGKESMEIAQAAVSDPAVSSEAKIALDQVNEALKLK